MTQELTTRTTAIMDEISVGETQKSKIEEEEEMQNDTIFDQVVTQKEDETREVNGIMLVDSLNGTDDEDEEMGKTQEKEKQERRPHNHSWPIITECHNF